MDLKEKQKERIKFFTGVFGKLILFSAFVSFILRIILIFHPETSDTFGFADSIKIFLIGFVNDICINTILCFFMWIVLAFQSDNKYKKPWGYIILSIYAILLCYSYYSNSIFHQYGGVVPDITQYFFIYKTISFALRLFLPSIRFNWSKIVFGFTFFLYILCILINAVSEYFFWNEFGVRYNFIAVDYLIYTNEVIGNIFESYPIIPMFSVLVLITCAISYLLTKNLFKKFTISASIGMSIIPSIIYFLFFIIACLIVNFNFKNIISQKIFVNELQSNGAHKFYIAFVNSKLDYKKFYLTLSEAEVCNLLQKEYKTPNCNVERIVTDSLQEIHKNVVLITIESMSASFLKHFGNEEGLTPNLDQLMDESMYFSQIYATGNRTVRGLEAVTLSLPPCPGESLIKQPNNDHLFCTGEVFRQKGYKVQYLYGGDAYFDNMKTFFGGNGYEIIDKHKIEKQDITFENIWGVCDEDLFNNAIKVFDKNTKTGQPFFAHIMTVSNHRPFTYPSGKIDISPEAKIRNGGVKYTDFAVGEFIKNARNKDWFKNTVFVIIADHCASSAGNTSIPLEKYQIPALILAPGFIQPQRIDKLVSQIDIMPTLLGLLNFSYSSFFYGKDVFAADYDPRAFVATYQDLGYLEQDILTVLSPNRNTKQYKVNKEDNKIELELQSVIDSTFLKEAVMYYQTSSPKKLQ